MVYVVSKPKHMSTERELPIHEHQFVSAIKDLVTPGKFYEVELDRETCF